MAEASETEFAPADIANAVQELLGKLSADRATELGRFAEIHQQRAARLAGAAARLQKALGEADPRVVALRQAGAASEQLYASANAEAAREARRPKAGPHEWVVFGRVLDAAGQPAAGLVVRVFDRDRKYDDLLGETTTDEHGDFAAVYHERDFLEAGEGLPELYVQVEDARGRPLYSSRDQLRYNAGRLEYFEIALPSVATGAPRPAAKGRPVKSKPAPSRKRAKKTG